MSLDESPKQANKKINVGKRKRDRTLSQPNTSAHFNVIEIEDDDMHVKLDSVLSLLQECMKKIESVDDKVTNLRKDFITHAEPINNEVKLDTLITEVKVIKDQLQITPEVVKSTVLNDQEVRVQLSTIVPDLTRNINNRKFSYYNHLHNQERYEIYNGWINQEEPFIPPNYLPKQMKHTESEGVYNETQRFLRTKFQHDMEIHKVRSIDSKAIYLSIDDEIERVIKETDITETTRKALIDEYIKRVVKEEEISKARWNKTKKKLMELPSQVKDKIVKVGERTYASVVKQQESQTIPVGLDINSNQEWTQVKRKNRNFTGHLPIVQAPMMVLPNFSQPPPSHQYMIPQPIYSQNDANYSTHFLTKKKVLKKKK